LRPPVLRARVDAGILVTIVRGEHVLSFPARSFQRMPSLLRHQ
jgi:hypothetical protein